MSAEEKQKGGRPKGSINRRSADVLARLEEHNINLVDQFLFRLAKADEQILKLTDPKEIIAAHLQVASEIRGVMPFCYSRRTAVEISPFSPEELALRGLSHFELQRRVVENLKKSDAEKKTKTIEHKGDNDE